MKRRLGAAVVVLAAVVAVGLWRCRGTSTTTRGANAATKSQAAATAGAARGHVDPRKVQRASIAGTVSDEDRAIVPRARVCAKIDTRDISPELVREPRCTVADDQGHYTLGELYAAEYVVAASAKPYRPDIFHPGGDRKESQFPLGAGERKTGVDIVLRKGGVEITGTVSDVTGGPIAHAHVMASRGWWGGESFVPPVDSDDNGKFSLWVSPGQVSASATAEGYAPGEDSGNAPGTFEILLTPESSLSGTVVDAKTGQPVPGVMVSIGEGDWANWFSFSSEGPSDLTDDQGKFHVTRLQPGRYVANARSAAGYGRSEGSLLVGLGQHVDGMIVKLHPGYQVSGKVVLPDKTTCKKSSLYLHDKQAERNARAIREPDGTLHADGVLPGTYHVSVGCDGYKSRDKYATIEVKDKAISGQVWDVEAGGTLRGRVVTKAGAPVAEARVVARTVGGAARAKTDWENDTTIKDGHYEIKGLAAGSFKLDVYHDTLNAPKDGWKVDVGAGAVVDKDLMLEDTGSIKGIVADEQGKPVGGVHVNAEGRTDASWNNGVRTNADGTFLMEGLRPGDYRVLAMRGWWSDSLRKPGSTDNDKQGERVTVGVGKVANVKIVVESQAGVITGTVVDTAGKPISDAYVSAARESDAAGALGTSVSQTRWNWDEKPVVSNLDGKFAVKQLSPGKYTLRAYRKGGGEAVAEHVAVGGTAKLQIRATGSIDGTVRRAGGKIEEVSLHLTDAKTGFSRRETFFRTDGKFVMRDLPQGNFTVSVESESGKKQLTLDLAEGQTKSGVEITLDELVSITGRVVDLMTKQPVAGIRMMAMIGKRGGGFSWSSGDDEQPNISDDDGRFTIEQAPRGAVTIRGFPKDMGESDYGWLTTVRDVAGNGTVDIGDVTVLKRRLKRNEVAGELGVKWTEQPHDTDLDKESYSVAYIDPKGPAAKTELKVGDVVTAVDGIDVTGINYSRGWMLLRAAPGTVLKLTLARGATITITLAAP